MFEYTVLFFVEMLAAYICQRMSHVIEHSSAKGPKYWGQLGSLTWAALFCAALLDVDNSRRPLRTSGFCGSIPGVTGLGEKEAAI